MSDSWIFVCVTLFFVIGAFAVYGIWKKWKKSPPDFLGKK